MARRTDSQVLRLGTLALVVVLLLMVAAFNLQKFPGLKGATYHAELTDASGLRKGNMVQIAGVRVGRVNDIRIEGDHVTVEFDVRDAEIGPKSRASVQTLNLLGDKYLEVEPVGRGTLEAGGTIPVGRTTAGYDIVSTLGELTDRTERIDTQRLSKALSTMGNTLNAASPEVRSSFTGLSRISRTIASRDDQLQGLLRRASKVTELLNERKGDLVALMKQGDLVFQELLKRKETIHRLLVNADKLAVQLKGLADDNRPQVTRALEELDVATRFLEERRDKIQKVVHDLGPYAAVLIQVLGTGPWFDATVPNLVGLGSGEFVPGKRER